MKFGVNGMSFLSNTDIGIDLGTSSTLVTTPSRGIVLREPSVVAVERATGRITAIGAEASRLLGRADADTLVIRPLRDGVISNFDVTARMLRYFYDKVVGKRLVHPRAVVCVPSGVTEAERRQVVEAVLEAGARYCYLIEEPLAAAIGAGADVLAPTGRLVLDIGGGTTDIAVLSYGTIVLSDSIRLAGDMLDAALMRYILKKHTLQVGVRSAEDIKIAYGRAHVAKEQRVVELRGRSATTGEPDSVPVGTNELVDAFSEPLAAIIERVRGLLLRTPPTLLSDIEREGVIVTGGGALLSGIDEYVTDTLGIPCRIPDDPVACVARGIGTVLENLPAYNGAITDYRRGEYFDGV